MPLVLDPVRPALIVAPGDAADPVGRVPSNASNRFGRQPTRQQPEEVPAAPLHRILRVEPHYFLALNKTCKYCPHCVLLLAHKDILEDLLARMFAERAPEIIGNDYLVVGTMDRSDWQEGLHAGVPLADMLRSLHDFKRVVTFKPAPTWGPENITRQRT